MTAFVASYLALVLAYSGMTGLCLAMNRHFAQVATNGSNHSRLFQRCARLLGWVSIILALFPCIHYWGASIGSVVWLGFLSLGALLVVWLFAYRPKIAMMLAIAALIAGATLALLVI